MRILILRIWQFKDSNFGVNNSATYVDLQYLCSHHNTLNISACIQRYLSISVDVSTRLITLPRYIHSFTMTDGQGSGGWLVGREISLASMLVLGQNKIETKQGCSLEHWILDNMKMKSKAEKLSGEHGPKDAESGSWLND
jgi:hypothetical protein